MRRFGVLLASIFFAGLTILPTQPAFAASNTIGVNPRRTYSINPGEKVNDFIVVTNNDTKNDLTASVTVLDFSAKDNSGTPALNLKENKPTPWSLSPYLSIPSTVKVGPGQSVNLNYTIDIPKNVGAGSYYSAIQFKAGGNTGGNVSLAGSAVSLFFVNVSGKATSTMQLLNFGAFQQSENPLEGVYNTFYSATPPMYVAYDLKNNGNVAEQPTGSILINDMIGKQYKLFSNANPDNNLVLIGQTRRIKVCINPTQVSTKSGTSSNATVTQCNSPDLKPGRYTAKLDLIYGLKGGSQQELRGTASFWYLPVWFIILVLVVLLVLIGMVWLIVHAIRNRRGTYSTRR